MSEQTNKKFEVLLHLMLARAKPLQCLTLGDPMDCSPPGSSVHGVFQVRILEWVAISSSRGILLTQGSNLCLLHSRKILHPLSHWGSPSFPASQSAQSCLTLCDPMDCSTPGLPVHHQLSGLTQTHVHRATEAIQPSHPLSSPSPPAFNLS